MIRKAIRIAAVVVIICAISLTPSSLADPTGPRLIECPDNTHIWGKSPADCNYDQGVTLGGGGGGNRCGGLCGLLRGIGGLFG